MIVKTTLQDLLDMEVESEDKDGNKVIVSPEFVIKVQSKTMDGLHILIHALGHSSETVDLIVNGDDIQHLGT